MGKMWFIGLLFAVVLISGCYGGQETGTPAATPQPGAPNTVEIKGFAFIPENITVQRGTTVTWINRDSAPHTATGEGFDSGSLGQGQMFRATFDQAGTFEYRCTIHPSMPPGRVIVT